MPRVPILMPQLGESIAEAAVLRILIKPGDVVVADQEIIEVETNKATMGVTTLCGGTVLALSVKEGETYAVGTLLGEIEATEEEIKKTGSQTIDAVLADGNSAEKSSQQQPVPGSENPQEASLKVESGVHFQTTDETYSEPAKNLASTCNQPKLAVPAHSKGAHYLSPRMKARMNELNLRESDISAIIGSGAGGRVTINDLEKFLDYVDSWPKEPAGSMRLAVADAMRRTWTRPLAACGRSVDFAPMLEHRAASNPRPGMTLYVVRALAIALAEIPRCAGYLVGDHIVMPKAFDVGVAVEVKGGIVVPLLRAANEKKLTGLVEAYNDLIQQARARRLPIDATKGGVATVTNFGGFGLDWAMSLPLPTESLILGVGAIKKVPVWNPEVGKFRLGTEAEMSLTFDHRVIDGSEAGQLLARVAALLQKPEDL